MRRQWSAKSRLAALGVSLTVATVASAICLRWIWAKSDRPGPKSDYSLCLVDAAGRPLSDREGVLRLVLDPFAVYRNGPNQRTESYYIDEHGFRGGVGSGAGPRVFLLGGSAAFGQDLPADEDTLTAQLSNLLRPVEFVNAGVVGYLSGQELALLVHYLDGHGPEGLIVFDGWNELFDQWLFGTRPPSRLGFNNSFFEIEDHLHAQVAASNGWKLLTRTLPIHADSQQVFDEVAGAYLSNLERMNAFARARGAWLLVAPQPEIGDRAEPTEEESTALDGWNRAYGYRDRGFSPAYRGLVNRTIEFCSSRGIPVVAVGRDPRFADADETLFLDPVHLSPTGARVAAAVLAEEVERVRGERSTGAPPFGCTKKN